MPKPKRIEVGRAGILQGPVVTADAIYVGLMKDVTVRLDRRTLHRVWEVDSQDLRLGAAVDGSYLTCGGNISGVRSATDGRLLWRAHSRLGGLTVWQGKIVVHSDGALELREPGTGEVIRVHQVPGGYLAWKAQDGNLGILEGERTFKALDLVSGELKWERPLVEEMQRLVPIRREDAPTRMAAGSRPGLLIAFHEQVTFGISSADGSILWHAPAWAGNSWPTPRDGRVYLLSRHRLVAIDEDTGAIAIDVSHPELERNLQEKAGTFYKDRFAVPNESGYLAVLSTIDGSLVSLYDAKMPLWRTAEADGRLFVATGVGSLLVFDESIWGLVDSQRVPRQG